MNHPFRMIWAVKNGGVQMKISYSTAWEDTVISKVKNLHMEPIDEDCLEEVFNYL